MRYQVFEDNPIACGIFLTSIERTKMKVFCMQCITDVQITVTDVTCFSVRCT